jgi:hypothetical protein
MKRYFDLIKKLVVLILAVMLWFPLSSAHAVEVEFHGYFESNLILRDTDGFSNGFMDNVDAVQQRNTLKFDVDVYLRQQLGPISLDKVHLTYRGAYDSIFSLTDRYDDVRKEYRPTKWDYGLNDIKTENDLREATFDLVYDGFGYGFIRPGRQIVQWGQSSPLTVVNIVNPADNSFQMFFLNPDDLKIPTWMVRTNYSLPPMASVNLNFDLLWVWDTRPQQFAPLDVSKDAPYAFVFEGLGPLPVAEEFARSRDEFGAEITADIGADASVSLMFYSGINDTPAMELGDLVFLPGPPFIAPTRVFFTHPWTKTYGGEFNWYLSPPFDLVLKGEFAHTKDAPLGVVVPTGMVDGRLIMYELTDMNKWMLGIDKNVWMHWLSNSMVNLGFMYMGRHVDDWEDAWDDTGTIEEFNHVLGFNMNWYHLSGKINPMIFVMYDTEGCWMTRAQVKWVINKNWYAFIQQQSFYGDTDNKGQFASMIDVIGELTFKIGFQW